MQLCDKMRAKRDGLGNGGFLHDRSHVDSLGMATVHRESTRKPLEVFVMWIAGIKNIGFGSTSFYFSWLQFEVPVWIRLFFKCKVPNQTHTSWSSSRMAMGHYQYDAHALRAIQGCIASIESDCSRVTLRILFLATNRS